MKQTNLTVIENKRLADGIYRLRLTGEQKKLEEELCSGNLSVEELTEKSKRLPEIKDGGEEQFFVDSKPIEVCRVARGKRCKMVLTSKDYVSALLRLRSWLLE